MNETSTSEISSEKEKAAKSVATLVYALQAAWLVFGIPLIVALVVNYVKLEDVRGTLAESHFRWQIRTFWFWLLWFVLGWLLVFLILTAVLGGLMLAANCVWIIYRIVKGWLRLNDGKPMYV